MNQNNADIPETTANKIRTNEVENFIIFFFFSGANTVMKNVFGCFSSALSVVHV